MNVNLLTTTENKLLERKEIEAEVSFDGATPKRAELKSAISQKIGADPDLMVLRKVTSLYGRHTVKVMAHAYSSKDGLMKVEPDHIKLREGLVKKEEKAAGAAEQK